MSTIQRFEDLEVWQKSRELCQEINKILLYEGLSRDYKLKDQIGGSSGSIMDNIAEGFERDGNKEFKQFLSISKGSVGELKSQLYRVLDKKYISQKEFDELYQQTDKISKMLGGFMRYLLATDFKGNKFKEPQNKYPLNDFDELELN